ncbi:copper amine oxidase [Acaromyces ingoldii]|uniref:Amine oxidase n=1 Tax=Acaromyces ingoldii TaxID=215250 RepID=A0A316YPG6_9BASI|nr:copper amine oxidase [Acaromyces ingoldii]PWN91042.1 copper amine oxidase [Acaromyces ingoldii]
MTQETPHPLDPATPRELAAAVDLIRKSCSGVDVQFKAAGLKEPSKEALLPFLRAERSSMPYNAPPRLIYVMFLYRHTPRLFDAVVDVTNGKILEVEEQPRGNHAPADRIEMNEVAATCLKSPLVQKELKRLGLDADVVVMDPWIYGRDDDVEDRRLAQVFFYIRNPKKSDDFDSNHYAFPLDFMAVTDMVEMRVEEIGRIPLGATSVTGKDEAPLNVGQPVEAEYAHHLQSQPARTTVKPLQVVQPQGASFTVAGSLVEWEKWRFRVGFNYREGMTIHDVTFDGREVFYRLSMSEMFVPYGDPRNPLHRKAAFDLGDVGAGSTANNLGLGCDCLGLIKYFDGAVIDQHGTVVPKPNAICMHEIDAGIQWKHTNHRTGKASVVRKRQLQLQTIITVANYEYIFYWTFDQAGEVEFETRATGILSTTPIDPRCDEEVPFATRVGDGVLAPYHQHIFCLRIDPCIDGDGNTVEVVDSVPMIADPVLNPYGTGYVTESRKIKTSGSEETDPLKARIFKIINPKKMNRVSKTPVGYKLMPISSQKLLAAPDSWHAKRAEFAHAPLWVTRHRDDELFPAGRYTNQSRGGTGIKSWVDRRDSVENQDLVLWHTYTFTHNPRTEDFPVMPAESVRIALKPINFFEYNPALDVPESTQASNKSVLYQAANGCCRGDSP